jgi:putative membrane protein
MGAAEIAIIVGVIVVVILLLGFLGGGMMGWGMMGYWGYGPGFGWWWIPMAIFWVLIIIGIVLLVVWLLGQARARAGGPGPSGSRALDILRERYARGEITREEYERMRRDLEGR